MADGMEQEKETKNLADRCSQMNGESDKAAPCLEDMMGRGHENMTVTEELLEVVKVASKKLVAEPLGVPSRTVQTPRFDVRREMPFGTCRPVEKPEWVRSHKDGESAYQKNQVPKTFVLPHWQGQRPRSLRVEVPFGPHSCHEAGESSTKLEQPLGIQASGKVKEKELTSSDVARHYKRLLLSKKNILSLNFLREEEKEIVKLPATKGDIEKRASAASCPFSRHETLMSEVGRKHREPMLPSAFSELPLVSHGYLSWQRQALKVPARG
ncbi:hypothetical protein CRG98_040268 [Punica granatum]|uniref:Uncharacterized protein n=1 Tax=Punica granatum TaxID=22663 RepID=A0A2I0I600_PUNGR|nr:hypothetical protein CRG98_040268 [Punica granatum]